MIQQDDYALNQPSEANKAKAKELLDIFHDRYREMVKVEYREGGRVLMYETTPGKIEKLIKRLSKTGEAKILNK